MATTTPRDREPDDKPTQFVRKGPTLGSRVWHEMHRLLTPVFGPVTTYLQTKRWVWRVPVLPTRYTPPPPWPEPSRDTPEQLKTVPGVQRDREAEARAFAEEPLHHTAILWPDAFRWFQRVGWDYLIPSMPRRHRAVRWTVRVRARNTSAEPPTGIDARALTEDLRRKAREIGISAIGFAPYDEKYEFAEFGPWETGTVVVCLLEQDWEISQQLPSRKTELHVMRVYEELAIRTASIGEVLQGKGFRAQQLSYGGEAIFIHYALEAGLGQLGLNGQLLTPQAGSRLRIALMMTNATLEYGQPVDYGIPAICDQCHLCIRRCPPGAIPNQRFESRGVMKAKIKTHRCLPVMAQAHACGVCMKVCPIQRYGLDAVKRHWVETGTVLGKGSDELEGFTWVDGRHYGPGQKPRMDRALTNPEGFELDPDLKRPPGSDTAGSGGDDDESWKIAVSSN
jgi:epoxyqueuosine reductase